MGFLVVVYARDERTAIRIRDRFSGGDSGRVVGMYALSGKDEPTCTGSCSRKRDTGWTRHDDGHIIHSCGKRHRDWRKRIATGLMDMFGINRLARVDTPRMFQNPEGWGD